MKQIFTILILFFYFSSNIFGQTRTEKTELKELKIIDQNLIFALDSFLYYEQFRDYYTDSLYIKIDICNYDWKIDEECHLSDSMSIVFFAISCKSLLFGKDNIGFFIYKNHLCIVNGQYLDKLLINSEKSKIFNFEISNSNIPFVPDDKYSIWDYLYANGVLILLHDDKN